jgi:hypothetical protein
VGVEAKTFVAQGVYGFAILAFKLSTSIHRKPTTAVIKPSKVLLKENQSKETTAYRDPMITKTSPKILQAVGLFFVLLVFIASHLYILL